MASQGIKLLYEWDQKLLNLKFWEIDNENYFIGLYGILIILTENAAHLGINK